MTTNVENVIDLEPFAAALVVAKQLELEGTDKQIEAQAEIVRLQAVGQLQATVLQEEGFNKRLNLIIEQVKEGAKKFGLYVAGAAVVAWVFWPKKRGKK